RCACGQWMTQCQFWSAVRQAMHRRGIEDYELGRPGTNVASLNARYARRLLAPLPRNAFCELTRDTALSLSPQWRAHLPRVQNRFATLVDVVTELTGSSIVIDSSKSPLQLKYLLRNPRLDIKVVRLVRDGRAVALTYTDEWAYADAADPSLRGGGNGQKRPSARANITDAAREWRRSNESADCVIARLPKSQWTLVKYEDLCANPAGTLGALCGFLQLDRTKVRLDFRARPQHIVGNGMRLDSTSEIRLDDRWRRVLSAEDLRAFELEAGHCNAKYGYSQESS